MFPPMPYLEWIAGRPERATHDLGSSDLRDTESTQTVVPSTLADLPDPDGETTFREQVATAYDVSTSEVLVTAGATHANLLAAATAFSLKGTSTPVPEDDREGPRLLVEKPGYQPLVETPKALGARVDRFFRPAEDGYPLEPARVESAIDDDTTLVTVTNRHNPSGRLTDRETFAEIARISADAGAYLLVDEVYAPFVGTPDDDGAFGGVTAAGLPNTVVTGSLTKFHGLGGVRIGWVVGPKVFVERAESVKKHIPAVAEPSMALGSRALHNEDRLTAASRELLRTNHAQLASFVADRSDLSGDVYEGCTFAFLSHDRADGDAVVEAAWDEGVLVVPGRFFDQSDAFRLSLGRSPDEVEAGLSVLGDVLDEL